jgi:hypothetical protein
MLVDLVVGSVLVVLPATRSIALLLLAMFHTANACIFSIGTFPLVMLSTTLLWIPDSTSMSRLW